MIEGILPAVGTGVAGIIVAVGIMARRWSRDKLEIAKDRAEENLIEHLIKQRNDALTEAADLKKELIAIAEENETAVGTIRQLTSENTQFKSQLRMLNILVKRLAAMKSAPGVESFIDETAWGADQISSLAAEITNQGDASRLP